MGVAVESSAAHSPHQNGRAERTNRTVCEMAACMLQDAALSAKFGALAVQHAAYVCNRLGRERRGWVTPYEAALQRVPDGRHLAPFGSLACTHVEKGARKKFEKRARYGLYVGHSTTHHEGTIMVFHPATQTVTHSRNVTLYDVPEHNAVTPLDMCRLLNANRERALHAHVHVSVAAARTGRSGGTATERARSMAQTNLAASLR